MRAARWWVIGGLALGGVAAGQAEPGEQARRPEQRQVEAGARQVSNAELARELHRGNREEIELGQLALQKTRNPKVREYARALIQHHQQLDARLLRVAQAEGIDLLEGIGGAGAQPHDRVREQPRTWAPRAGAAVGMETQAGEEGLGGAGQDRAALDARKAQISQRFEELTDEVKSLLGELEDEAFDRAFLAFSVMGHDHEIGLLQEVQPELTGQLATLGGEALGQLSRHRQQAHRLLGEVAPAATPRR